MPFFLASPVLSAPAWECLCCFFLCLGHTVCHTSSQRWFLLIHAGSQQLFLKVTDSVLHPSSWSITFIAFITNWSGLASLFACLITIYLLWLVHKFCESLAFPLIHDVLIQSWPLADVSDTSAHGNTGSSLISKDGNKVYSYWWWSLALFFLWEYEGSQDHITLCHGMS
jgi:hypothetical protein